MRAEHRQTKALGAWPVLGLLLLGACGRDGVEAPTGTGTPAETKGGVRITKLDHDLTAHAMDLGEQHLQVELHRIDGAVVFMTDSRPVNGQSTRVSDTYFPGLENDTDAPSELSELLLESKSGQQNTLEDEIAGAAFVHAQRAAAELGAYAVADHWGCDIPGIGDQVSCSGKGACCDAHDDCYEKHGCTSASWKDDASSDCQKLCNSVVEACLLGFGTPGKSVCCDAGNCGVSRSGEPDDGAASTHDATVRPGVGAPGMRPSGPNAGKPTSAPSTPSRPSTDGLASQPSGALDAGVSTGTTPDDSDAGVQDPAMSDPSYQDPDSYPDDPAGSDETDTDSYPVDDGAYADPDCYYDRFGNCVYGN